MFGRFSSSMGLVGVDFGAHGIKMLQVREVSPAGELEVVGAAKIDVPLAPVPNAQPKSATPLPTAAGWTPAASNPSESAESARSEHQPSADAPTRSLAEQIRTAFAGGGFTGRRCVVSLGRHDVCVQSIRLPKMPDAELKQTAGWEAAQRFGFARDAMEVDFIRTGALLANGENREEVIVVAASHAAINARLEPILEAGLRPVAVDTDFAALVRTFSRRVRRESDVNLVRAVVEIGASGSTVLILRGDQIAFCKPLAISGALFNRAVAEHLQMSVSDAAELRQARIAALQPTDQSASASAGPTLEPAASLQSITDPATDRAVHVAVRPIINELIKELMLCLRYYGVTFRGHPPERIILTGGDALEPKLDESVARACKLPVAFDDAPVALTTLHGSIQTSLNRWPGPAASWSTAMGLSLRGINRQAKRERSGADDALMKGAA